MVEFISLSIAQNRWILVLLNWIACCIHFQVQYTVVRSWVIAAFHSLSIVCVWTQLVHSHRCLTASSEMVCTCSCLITSMESWVSTNLGFQLLMFTLCSFCKSVNLYRLTLVGCRITFMLIKFHEHGKTDSFFPSTFSNYFLNHIFLWKGFTWFESRVCMTYFMFQCLNTFYPRLINLKSCKISRFSR